MEQEIWKPIDINEQYLVSNFGNVFNKKNKKLLKPIKTKKGYSQVHFYMGDHKYKVFLIHRLVAKAFPEICGEWFEGCQINHKDECKSNNIASNLEVCTQKYNLEYNNGQARRGMKKRVPVAQYDLQGIFIKEWDSATTIEKELGFSRESITSCCRGKTKTAHKFIFKYSAP